MWRRRDGCRRAEKAVISGYALAATKRGIQRGGRDHHVGHHHRKSVNPEAVHNPKGRGHRLNAAERGWTAKEIGAREYSRGDPAERFGHAVTPSPYVRSPAAAQSCYVANESCNIQ